MPQCALFDDGVRMGLHSTVYCGDLARQHAFLGNLQDNGAEISLVESADVVIVDIGRCGNLSTFPSHVEIVDYSWVDLSVRTQRAIDLASFRLASCASCALVRDGQGVFENDGYFFAQHAPPLEKYDDFLRRLRAGGARICFDVARADIVVVNLALCAEPAALGAHPEANIVDFTWVDLCLRTGQRRPVGDFLPASFPAGPCEESSQTTLAIAISQAPTKELQIACSTITDAQTSLLAITSSAEPQPRAVPQTAAGSSLELYPPVLPAGRRIIRGGGTHAGEVHQFFEALMEWQLLRDPSMTIWRVSQAVDKTNKFSRRAFLSYWRPGPRRKILTKIKARVADMRRRGVRAVGTAFGSDEDLPLVASTSGTVRLSPPYQADPPQIQRQRAEREPSRSESPASFEDMTVPLAARDELCDDDASDSEYPGVLSDEQAQFMAARLDNFDQYCRDKKFSDEEVAAERHKVWDWLVKRFSETERTAEQWEMAYHLQKRTVDALRSADD